MSQDITNTIAESFNALKYELEIQYEERAAVEEEPEAISQATNDDHEVTGEPPAKK